MVVYDETLLLQVILEVGDGCLQQHTVSLLHKQHLLPVGGSDVFHWYTTQDALALLPDLLGFDHTDADLSDLQQAQ